MEGLDGKITGDTLPAAEWNQLPAEVKNVITQLGQSLTSSDLNQLGKSIAGYVANGTFYTDSGISDAYVLTKIGSKQSAQVYTDGFEASFIAGNVNSGASTVNIAGIGVKSIKLFGGIDPAEGDITGRVDIIFSDSNDWFELLNQRSNNEVLDRDTLQDAIEWKITKNNDAINVKEETAGNGGGSVFDVVLLSSVTTDDVDVFASTGGQSPALALVRREDTLIQMLIEQGLADVSQLATATEDDFSDIQTAVEDTQAANEADPDVSDAPTAGDAAPTPMNTTADMLHRQRNNLTGVNSAQLPTVVGSFATSRKYDVDENTTYTISMHGAPLGFFFVSTAEPDQIQFFNTDGTLNKNETTGFTNGAEGREITFLVPAGAEKVSFPIRNFTDFSNDSPMTEVALQQCVDAIMLNKGSSAENFAPFAGGLFAPQTSIFDPVDDEAIKVSLQAPYGYIRTKLQQSTDKDCVWRVLFNQGFNRDAALSKSGSIDFYGARFVSSSETDTIAAFNQSTQIHCSGFDEGSPIRINNMFVAGSHGATSYIGNMVAHGKTNIDIGSIWLDGTDQWALYFINDVDSVTMVRVNTGTVDKWIITSADFSALTLTHVSGATNTANFVFTSSSQDQFRPIIRDYITELRIDNSPVSADGDYTGTRVVLNEYYSLMNLAKQQADLISKAGSGVDPDGIAAANSSAGATLTLDGVLTVGGAYTSDDAMSHTMTFLDLGAHDQTTATYTITGEDFDGNVLVENIAGPGVSSSVETTGFFFTVTDVAIASPVAGSTVDFGPGQALPDYVSQDIEPQIVFRYEFEWNDFGAMSIRTGYSATDGFSRDPNSDYFGGVQFQRLAATFDSQGGMHDRFYVYLPEIAPVSGLDFEAIAEVTSNAAEIRAPAASCDDPADPASHGCLFGRDPTGTTNISGQVFGYSREQGNAIPATRAADTTSIYRISPAEKNYLYLIDDKAGDAAAGEYVSGTGFRAPFLSDQDITLSVPGIIVTMDGSTFVYITSHANQSAKSIAIPAKFNRFPVTIIKDSPNVTITSGGFVENNAIVIDVINSYGDIVLKLGG